MKNKLSFLLILSFFVSLHVQAQEDAYTVVDQSPQFPGGMTALYKYVNANLVYPVMAKRLGTEGRVFVEFVVETNGEVTNVRTIKGLSERCNAEAERVMRDSPNFTPGRNKGQAVPVKMVLPINFSLSTTEEQTDVPVEEPYRPPATSLQTAIEDSSVTELTLEFQELGNVDQQISEASQLVYLNLTGNQLKELPASIGELTALEELFLTYNLLHELPDAVASLSALRTLYLDRNTMSEFPLVILDLPSLESLDISYTSISLLPLQIAEMPNLKYVYARGTKISVDQITAIRKINPKLRILK